MLLVLQFIFISCYQRVKNNTPVENEPKFLVFYSMLLSLFSMFCFRCKSTNPRVEMKQNGTMVTVIQHCKHCEGHPFTWKSQPYHLVLGKYPAGNILLSFAVLLAGASISKVLLVFRHMGLCAYHPHLLCTPEEVSVPSDFTSLGDLQSSPYKPAKDHKRCSVERRWKI